MSARLAALRGLMAKHAVAVYLVPAGDEHGNEYPAAHKRRREAISGFGGSAGELAVCETDAHLFVDSRYHRQAQSEVPDGLFALHKLGLEGEQDLYAWLRAHDQAHGPLRVGFDPFLVNLRVHGKLAAALEKEGSSLQPIRQNLVDEVWAERPEAGFEAAFALPDAITGETVADKLARVRQAMADAGAGALVLTRLDEVAWLTNLRGSGIPYSPVFEAYLLVEAEGAACFTDTPVPQSAREPLRGLVEIRPYGEFADAVARAARAAAEKGSPLWLDSDSASEGLRLLTGEAPVHQSPPNPVVKFKAVKNPVEIEGMREGHVKAGLAKVRAFSLLSARLAEGERLSEADFAELLEKEYAREEGFRDLSFATISAFGPNGAVVHYGTPDPAVLLEPGGMLLVDSGVQLLGATTDDTRTVAIGTPTRRQRERYTDVLRAHIGLAMQVFPSGTNGQMLDAIARSPLWNNGLDFGHGTGHGVGAFLNVHEGPQAISPTNTVALEAGMIVSNEPGYYRAGWGGIRLENLYLVDRAPGLRAHPAGKTWLRMVPLTLIPFDRNLIDPRRMTQPERAWLEDYHRTVAQTLAPLLAEPHRAWLAEACQAVG
ncbi:MAG: aminopeptidase P family protein [bacterium]